jgi:hypothetical protein
LASKRYEAAFRENAIDDTVLHDLTEDHLREIGIPIGARLGGTSRFDALKQANSDKQRRRD